MRLKCEKNLRHEPPRARTHLTTTKTTSCPQGQVLCESSQHGETITAAEARCNATVELFFASFAFECLMREPLDGVRAGHRCFASARAWSKPKCFHANERWIVSTAYTARLCGSVGRICRRKVCQFGATTLEQVADLLRCAPALVDARTDLWQSLTPR